MDDKQEDNALKHILASISKNKCHNNNLRAKKYKGFCGDDVERSGRD